MVHVHDASLSLCVKPFSFPRRNTKLKREERERVGSWERAGEFCLRRWCFVCGMPREGGEGKKDSSFLEWRRNEFHEIFSIFFQFFFLDPNDANGYLSLAFAFNVVAKWEAKNLFDFKSRQTNKKQEVVKKHNKRRKREGPESQYAFNWCSQMFTHCNVLFNILMK